MLFEAQALGIEMPGALSIVDCDNLPIASQTKPALTTILLPTGERAALAVINWLAHGEPPPRERPPTDLIVRGTTAQPCAAALQPTLA